MYKVGDSVQFVSISNGYEWVLGHCSVGAVGVVVSPEPNIGVQFEGVNSWYTVSLSSSCLTHSKSHYIQKFKKFVQ